MMRIFTLLLCALLCVCCDYYVKFDIHNSSPDLIYAVLDYSYDNDQIEETAWEYIEANTTIHFGMDCGSSGWDGLISRDSIAIYIFDASSITNRNSPLKNVNLEELFLAKYTFSKQAFIDLQNNMVTYPANQLMIDRGVRIQQ